MIHCQVEEAPVRACGSHYKASLPPPLRSLVGAGRGLRLRFRRSPRLPPQGCYAVFGGRPWRRKRERRMRVRAAAPPRSDNGCCLRKPLCVGCPLPPSRPPEGGSAEERVQFLCYGERQEHEENVCESARARLRVRARLI